MFHYRFSIVAAVLGLVGSVTIARAAIQYTVTDLAPAPGNTVAFAYGLNNHGDVVGESLFGSAGNQAVIWRNGVPTSIVSGGSGSQVNDAGVVAGFYGSQYAYSWSESRGFSNLNSALLGPICANSINNSGLIVGYAGGSHLTATTWTNGTPTAIPGIASRYGVAWDVNDGGQISAEVAADSGQTHAWRISGDQSSDLGALWTAGKSRGIAISPTGEVVGDGFVADGSYRPVLFGDTEAKYLGTLGGAGGGARDMSADGTIIGWSGIDATGTMHAFIYQSGVMTDLNDLIDPSSGWVLRVAYRMNDLGQIAGSGTINGQSHAFLLTPVPEPTAIVVAMAALVLAPMRRRKAFAS